MHLNEGTEQGCFLEKQGVACAKPEACLAHLKDSKGAMWLEGVKRRGRWRGGRGTWQCCMALLAILALASLHPL